MEIVAYEMKFAKDVTEMSKILCTPFEKQYFQEYMNIYNECFYEMRKTLDTFIVFIYITVKQQK